MGDTEEMYLQGLSTSMPADVQYRMLRSLPGFSRAEIMRYAYAIEYDCCDPTQLCATLEFKEISGLYGAGQFNGTSGYEEAAAQGLVAGINAALKLKGEEPLILERSGSYIGTLIDDLVTKGTNEPYRIMTSRSEYRLLLRQDNADLRLTELGRRVGLITDDRYRRFLERRRLIELETERLEKTYLSPALVNPFLEGLGESPVATGISLADLLRRPSLDYVEIAPVDTDRPALPRSVTITTGINIKYEGYIKRGKAEAAGLPSRAFISGRWCSAIRGCAIEAANNRFKPRNMDRLHVSVVSTLLMFVLLIYFGKK